MPALTKPRDRRSVVVVTRVTEGENKRLLAMAEKEAVSLSNLIRAKLFPQTVKREEDIASLTEPVIFFD